VDDARLVALNAVDAAERGAEIATRTELLSATRSAGRWRAKLSNGREVEARMLVNAAGPWVAEMLGGCLHVEAHSKVRLIRGSHIVVPALHGGDHAYILQQPDDRVVFALPYEGRFTLIGTTDVPVNRPDDDGISPEETAYLCAAANRYFERQIAPGDVAWSYSGIRALYDSGEAAAQAVTRDYHLELDDGGGAPLLSLFGGKITTARALAEEALEMLGVKAPRWTATAPLPGGDAAGLAEVKTRWPWLPPHLRTRLIHAYGSRMADLLGDAGGLEALGRHFGADLYEAEVHYLVTAEYARSAEDILWRRTKCGLFMSPAERDKLASFLAEHFAALSR
ncbi:MAG TPA: glycerol-3-phosphate dehydrogenase, partial [Allosphingosinicella sp.]